MISEDGCISLGVAEVHTICGGEFCVENCLHLKIIPTFVQVH